MAWNTHFTGMRQRMREAFDEIWIIDLEGDNLGARKTENVFAIQTPVCIAIGIRHAEKKKNPLARTHYVRVEGSRDEKLAKLKAIKSFEDVLWSDCFIGAQEPFLPQQAGNYFSWPLMTDLWPLQLSGVQWKRRWPIGETEDVLTRRWQHLVSSPLNQKSKLFRETESRTIDRIGRLFRGGNELPSTGATLVSVSDEFANQALLQGGEPTTFKTANGDRPGRVVTDVAVSVGPVTVPDVRVGIGLTGDKANDALLGQSFLSRFDVMMNKDQMVLRPSLYLR